MSREVDWFALADNRRRVQLLQTIGPESAANAAKGTPYAAFLLGVLLKEGQLDLATRFFKGLMTSGDGNEFGLEVHATDSQYLSAVSELVGPEAVRRVIDSNKPVLDSQDFERLEESLYTGNINKAEYVLDKANLFRSRMRDEYRLYGGLNLEDVFPYKYLTDYAYRAEQIASTLEKSVKVSLIYCIKNRVKRTAISLYSLERSWRKYLSKGLTGIELDVIIVEDVSHDILKLDGLKLNEANIDHYIVDTGIAWTRSGLLNYGIKKSNADILGFVDADFLFHDDYFEALGRAIKRVDWQELVLANNLIETEAHKKGKHVYSAGSPYSYLWMAPRQTVLDVGAFDEGYTGHGFEDRDFELKLTALGGLTVTDTVSIDEDCFVLHLSHVVRDGIEKQKTNRKRFNARFEKSKEDPQSLNQSAWGEQELIKHIVKRKGMPAYERKAASGAIIDVLFVPHNGYHAKSSADLAEALRTFGVRSKIVNISPPHPEEGVAKQNSNLIHLDTLIEGAVVPRCIVVFNDWENRVVRHLNRVAAEAGIETVGIVEGVNDFFDVDTGKNRTAYRRVNTVILNGEFDRRYFADSDQKIYVGGVQRLDELLTSRPTESASAVRAKDRPMALINVNFSYGVLGAKRDSWLRGAIAASKAAGFEPVISQHIADTGPTFGIEPSPEPLYKLFERATVVISRFSGVILEALASNISVIYYNPNLEKVDKFSEPLDAYWKAENEAEIESALSAIKAGERRDPAAFLRTHCDIEDSRVPLLPGNSSIDKTAQILYDIVSKNSAPDFETFTKSFRNEYISKSKFIPSVSPETEADINNDVTFGIKSFGRPQHVLKLISSIRERYPHSHITVMDDSDCAEFKVPKNVDLIRSEQTDIGLSAGRNTLIDKCETKYFVLLDDDFIFTDKTRIEDMVEVLKTYDLDIVGGSVFDVGPSAQKKDQPRTFYGCFDFENDGDFKISTGKVRQWQSNVPLYDLVLNFFVAKTQSLRAVRWTDEFKLGEHLDFFIRAREQGLKISYVDQCVVDHYRDHSANTEEYKEYRRRADEYHKLFKSRYDISRILLNNDEIPG